MNEGISKSKMLLALFIVCICFESFPFLRRSLQTNNNQILNIEQSLIFEGSDYDIGRQLGEHYRDMLKEWKDSSVRFLANENREKLKSAYNLRIEEIESTFPGQLNEWRGIADQLSMCFDDVALKMIGENTIRRMAKLPVNEENEPRFIEGCSSFAITHSDYGPILGKTYDDHYSPKDPSKTKVGELGQIYKYDDGYTYLKAAGAILNDQGLAVGETNAHYYGQTDVGDGKAAGLSRLVARYCPNVDSAVVFMRKWRATDDGRHFCMVDKNGRAAAVEKGPGDLFNVKYAGSKGYVYVSNTSPAKHMRMFDKNDNAYRKNAGDRLKNFEKMFSTKDFDYTFESAKRIITNHDSVGAICQHQERYPWQWSTRNSRLVLPAKGKIYQAEKLSVHDSYKPCENEWKEISIEIE